MLGGGCGRKSLQCRVLLDAVDRELRNEICRCEYQTKGLRRDRKEDDIFLSRDFFKVDNKIRYRVNLCEPHPSVSSASSKSCQTSFQPPRDALDDFLLIEFGPSISSPMSVGVSSSSAISSAMDMVGSNRNIRFYASCTLSTEALRRYLPSGDCGASKS